MNLDPYAVQAREIQHGIVHLQQRQRFLSILTVAAACVVLMTGVGLWMHQDFVYSFFGLSHDVTQLHIPSSVDSDLFRVDQQPDYFLSLLAWFGWLFTKVFVAFFGSFFLLSCLKKIKFFQQRFRSWSLRIVAWCIACIVLWSGLSYWQHDTQHEQKKAQDALLNYQNNIHSSEIAQRMQDESLLQPIQAYLLAQTALLHAPVDTASAKGYVQDLIYAEQHDAKFKHYGFSAEQIWIMQQQLYGKSMSPLAKSVEVQVQQADHLSDVVRQFLAILLIIFLVILLVLAALNHNIKSRLSRIQQRLT